jgi:hypothetical protein
MHRLYLLFILILLSCTPITPKDEPIEWAYGCVPRDLGSVEQAILESGFKPVDSAGCVNHTVTSEEELELRGIAPKHHRANLVCGHILIYQNGTLVEIRLVP